MDDDSVLPFQLESSRLRGRIVHLGPALDSILTPHGYPEAVAHLVAETATMVVLLSSMLKYQGIFTLQAKGDGPISMLVADITSAGDMRACASFDPERLSHAQEQLAALSFDESAQNHLAQYLGRGYMAFTVDQGSHTDRYQGIVELKGASLVDCVQHYFTQSEQIGTGIVMAVGKRDGHWRAGGIMLQHMPEDQKNPQAGRGNVEEDDWRRAMVLLQTCRSDELLAADLPPRDLLRRLFHEEGVRVYTPLRIHQSCRCTRERVENVLRTLDPEDLAQMQTPQGRLQVTCEFCSQSYDFDPAPFLAQNGIQS